jgi:hypothetical protein
VACEMAVNATLSVLGGLSIGMGDVSWISSGSVVVRNDANWSVTCRFASLLLTISDV